MKSFGCPRCNLHFPEVCSLPRAPGKICALNRTKKFPKLAESQCPPALIVASPHDYAVEITIAVCGIRKHGVLVKPVITETDAAKFHRFLISEFDLLELLVRAAKRSRLVYYFLLELADFCCSSVALVSCQTRTCALPNDFDEAGLLVWTTLQ
jgi:hypothetical protein